MRAEKQEGWSYKVTHEQYNLLSEEKKVLNETVIATSEKLYLDVVKYVKSRSFSATAKFLKEEEALEYVKDFDVQVIYRNDAAGFNECFGFEIREGMDLKRVKFARHAADNKKKWIDVGGRAKWRKYPFPSFRFTSDEALAEIGINQELMIVGVFQTIVLLKQPTGNYTLATKIDSEKLEIFDKWRKIMENSAQCIYRTVQAGSYTDKHDFILSLPFMDKISTVHIYNDYDCRSI